MQKVCLLFSGCETLQDWRMRQAVLRIPEVSMKIKQAQNLLDCGPWEDSKIDFYSYILSCDEDFHAKPKLKNLITAVVQVGLFNRYIKHRNLPSFMMGTQGPLNACTRNQSFEELVLEAEYSLGLHHISTLRQKEQDFQKYEVYKLNKEHQYVPHSCQSEEAMEILEELQLNGLIDQCVYIGPSDSLFAKKQTQMGILSPTNSVDMDPILESFWKSA